MISSMVAIKKIPIETTQKKKRKKSKHINIGNKYEKSKGKKIKNCKANKTTKWQ